MRNVMRVAVFVLMAGVVLQAIGTIEEVNLADGRDDVNRISAPIVDGSGVAPLALTVTAAFDRKAKIVRRGATGFFTKGPEYNLGKAVDLGALFTQALRAEAGAMGFKVSDGAAGWQVEGTIKDVYLESKQIPYGATLFYGFLDVEWTVKSGAGAPQSRRTRLHNYNGGYNAGMGRKDEAMVALAHLLVEGAQEAIARFNRELFKAPPLPAVLSKAATAGSATRPPNDLHLLGLAGDATVADALLALVPKEADENRRSSLIEALSRIGSSAAVAPLAGRFATEDEDCRWYTLKAMDYIGGDAALALVRDQGVKDKDGGPRRLAERIAGAAGKS